MRWLAWLLCLAGCNYSFEGAESAFLGETLTVPYIQGDVEGKLTTELIRQIAASGVFVPVQASGVYTLKVKIIGNVDKKIGYRHHRGDTSGRLHKRLMPTEDRRVITAEVTLIEEATGNAVIGPEIISASAEFDYVDPDSIRELAFKDAKDKPRTVLDFSLGQLDSIEGAQDNVNIPLFRVLSQKIIDGILNQEP